ncbi:hypothetical protein HID58_092052 [Brassica napus]|uniref:Uncharacterized protein n=1 Tax=Brassica napus TaxID=3708 RepID=A0ABQ7WXQ7_BRANA|nr:hypothetical protein HID58_092052 [Brassica napus]
MIRGSCSSSISETKSVVLRSLIPTTEFRAVQLTRYFIAFIILLNFINPSRQRSDTECGLSLCKANSGKPGTSNTVVMLRWSRNLFFSNINPFEEKGLADEWEKVGMYLSGFNKLDDN